MNFFTVVSLVIALSGSTYGVIVAIRNIAGDSVRKARQNADPEIVSIENDPERVGTENTESARNSHKSLGHWARLFQWAYVVPVVLFALISFFMAVHVCVVTWSGDVGQLSMWSVYKWVLLGILVVDVIAIVVELCAWRRILAKSKEVHSRYLTWVQNAPVEDPPSPISPNVPAGRELMEGPSRTDR